MLLNLIITAVWGWGLLNFEFRFSHF